MRFTSCFGGMAEMCMSMDMRGLCPAPLPLRSPSKAH